MIEYGSEYPFQDPRNLPFAPIRSRGELPHLFKDGCWHFVTARLWDAVTNDKEVVDSEVDPFSLATAHETPIGLGACFLARPDIADLVQNALLHFSGERYVLAAWCIMPNHMHLVIMPLGESTLTSLMHSIKSYTAHNANKLLDRTGAFWERESFNHLVRSAEDLQKFIEYTENNPVAARICSRPEDWKYGSAQWKMRRNKSAGGTPAPQEDK